MSNDNLCCKRNDRNACHLADIRNRTAGTGIYFNDVYFLTAHNELNVDQSDDMQGLRQLSCIVLNGSLCLLRNTLCRINGNTVSGVDSRTLDMLHDTRDQDILAVAYRIYFDLFSLKVLINQNRVILCNPVDNTDKFINVVIVDGNLHSLSAKYIGWTHKNRITQTVCNLFGFLCCKDGSSGRTRDSAFFQNFIKQLSVFCCIYILGRCTKDRHSHLHQCLCQLDSSLSAELHNRSVRFLQIDNTLHIFRCQRFKIQLICNVKVCTYCLRVIIYNNRLIAFF